MVLLSFRTEETVVDMVLRALLLPLLAAVSLSTAAIAQSTSTGRPPNVLFVAIDDLNDWITPFGGACAGDYAEPRIVCESGGNDLSKCALCGSRLRAFAIGFVVGILAEHHRAVWQQSEHAAFGARADACDLAGVFC